MIKQLVFLAVLFVSVSSFAAAELLVKPDSITYSGFSSITADKSVIFGGIAGTPCTGDNVSTCNSCATTTTADACNLTSVYSSLKFTVSFKVTKTITGVAKLYIEGATAGDFSTAVVTLPSASYTQDSSTVTLETTWSEICLRAGLNASCVGSSVFATKGIKFGVDSDSSGDVEEAERKSATIKFHYMQPSAVNATQSFCAASGGAETGVCNIAFVPGDAKAFIDSAIYNGADSSATLDWESIAIFPIATLSGGEAAAYTSFASNAVTPIFKSINTDGTIPDSQVTGAIENYQLYCLVYGTKNQAQNIFRIVNDPTAASNNGCVTPSEVVGVLEDKNCFISTAAFGSSSAYEVKTFRQFRNRFLLTNFFGKKFVKYYYKLSPPIAEVIAGNEFLKAVTRTVLFPFYIFSVISIQYGIWAALVCFVLSLFIIFKLMTMLKREKVLMMFLILLISPSLKAVESGVVTVENHPQAKEGLVRIRKDGSYIYDVSKPLRKESSSLRFGQANQPEISLIIDETDASGNLTGNKKEFNFADFYNETSGIIIGYDYEWYPLVNYGKLGMQLGVSAMVVSGNGRLVATPNGPSKEAFTFVTMPLTFGGIYRLEWKDKQLFAPYVAGGGTYLLLLEKREDIAAPKVAGGLGYYGTGGLLFNVSALDGEAGFQLDSEYGISNLWISIEFKLVEVNNEAFGFSNQYVNAGLSFDF